MTHPTKHPCPHCGQDITSVLATDCAAYLGAKGKGKAKARTSEQARNAANVRWKKHRTRKTKS
jgi:hypothetical protein